MDGNAKKIEVINVHQRKIKKKWPTVEFEEWLITIKAKADKRASKRAREREGGRLVRKEKSDTKIALSSEIEQKKAWNSKVKPFIGMMQSHNGNDTTRYHMEMDGHAERISVFQPDRRQVYIFFLYFSSPCTFLMLPHLPHFILFTQNMPKGCSIPMSLWWNPICLPSL